MEKFFKVFSFIVGLIALVTLHFLPEASTITMVVAAAGYVVAAFGIIKEAFENITHGEIFDENFLMVFASVAALVFGEADEALIVVLLFRVGEELEEVATGKAEREIKSLNEIRSDFALVEKNGALCEVKAQEVEIGTLITLRPGDRAALDGIVQSGQSQVNTFALTGESTPTLMQKGSEILSGSINETGTLIVKTTKRESESTAQRILDLIENASETKTKTEAFITRFARVYTPSVIAAALILALVPSLVFGQDFRTWALRALNFLVISCPCALVISVPLSFFSAIGKASRMGILFKGSSTIEALAKARSGAFDKTGTLTEGVFQVNAVHPDKITSDELMKITASAEMFSNHPIAHSITSAMKEKINAKSVSDFEEFSGYGVKANVEGKKVIAGNEKLMAKEGIKTIPCDKCTLHQGQIHVAIDGEYAGHIVVSDKPKEEAESTIRELKDLGIYTSMLTGDKQATATEIAKVLGVDEVHSQLLPGDKVALIDRLKEQSKSSTVFFVGDGINDAPSLIHSDVGISLGKGASQAAVEASDVIITSSSLKKVSWAIRFARRTLGVARQNIAFSLFVKAVVFALSIFGLSPMWLAILSDVGVTCIAILNALRLWI